MSVKVACRLGILLLLVLLVLFVVFLLRTKPVRLFIRMMAPPQDLYERLIDAPCDVTGEGVVGKFAFKHKYFGKYEIGILLSRYGDHQYFNRLSDRSVLKLRIEVKFYEQDALILAHVIGDDCSPFLGREGNGLTLFVYDCPGDLPLDKVLLCEVRIIEPDSTLANSYGPVRFFISKMSDE